ncbi:MAG: exosortase-associated protein EpsI, V-type [Sphingomonadaceae bacterium]
MSANQEAPTGISRRNMMMGAALVATSAAAFVRQPREIVAPLKKGSLEALVPDQVGAWSFETKSGLVLPPSDALSDSLYNDIVTRVYYAPQLPPIMLLIAYSNTQNGTLQVHRPEVCYPASGYTLSETEVTTVGKGAGIAIPARFFSAESNARTEQVLYWTRIGTALPTSWIDQRRAVIGANLQGIIPDGILVRISTIVPETDTALAGLDAFVTALAKSLNPQARKLLIGL